MPECAKAWWHLILTAHGTWLPGDPRGFRSREHRIHSSGDYKQPPPAGEHAGLHQHHQQHVKSVVRFPAQVLPVIGNAIVRKATRDEHRLLALAVGSVHCHMLIELEDDWKEAKRIAGTYKQAASRAVSKTMPGKLWTEGGNPVRIRNREHHREVYQYILDHADEGAWIWSYRSEEPK